MKKQLFNSGWTVTEGDGSNLAALMGVPQVAKEVNLPHDFSIEVERNAEEQNGAGVGYFHMADVVYKKSFHIDEKNQGKRVYVEFEGVYQNSFVYVNNAFVMNRPYGYTNFSADITRYLKFDEENEIKVVVRNGVRSGRWYTGTGIYRDVNIIFAEDVHYRIDGVRIKASEISGDLATLVVDMDVLNKSSRDRDVFLKVEVMKEGRNITSGIAHAYLPENSEDSYSMRLYVENPELWDDENPNLYEYKASIIENDNEIDVDEGTFGIRELKLDHKNGLRVNGRTVNLRGGCLHHDNGIIGARDFYHASYEKVKALKEAGFNAIRSAHNPISRSMLQACDELGVYIMDEFADVWTSTKVTYDYGTNMSQWWEEDITNMVLKDYNHPSVILYSIGNEIPEIGNNIDSTNYGKKLADKIKSLDSTRYTTNAMNLFLAGMDQLLKMMPQGEQDKPKEINTAMNEMAQVIDQLMQNPMMAKRCEVASSQVDVVGYNYALGRYVPEGEEYPNRVIVGSETNAGDLDKNWDAVEKLSYVIGDFDWTCWDYLGEAGIGGMAYGDNPPTMYAKYPYKAAYCGDFNLIGDRRPSSFWREIVWGFRNKPYIAVQDPAHFGEKKVKTQWTFSDSVHCWNYDGFEGKPVNVEVYADADEVELLINDKPVKRIAPNTEKKYFFEFETTYVPGKITAVSYKDGKESGKDEIMTAGENKELSIKCDKDILNSGDPTDIAYIDISITDTDGIFDASAQRKVSYMIEGPAEVLGFGSARPFGEENFYDETAVTYEGRLRAVVRGCGKGTANIRFSSEGMTDVTVKIEMS